MSFIYVKSQDVEFEDDKFVSTFMPPDSRTFHTSKQNQYKLIDEIDGVFTYYCSDLRKYKIVNHKKGMEYIMQVVDWR